MSVPSWVRVGAKVVCVDASGFDRRLGEVSPETGGVYTIRLVKPSNRWPGELAVRLVEIVNEPHWYKTGFAECSFRLLRFRPLVTKTQEQDVSIFAPLLKAKVLERL